uniref:Putative bovine pancreatic trypsin inhibitor n=1 Tax=Rhipicephalus microplus TaxID=6941 RepID=A0A6G5A9C5_RHIMP
MLRKSKLIFVCIYYSQLLGLWNTAHGGIDITTMKPKKCMKAPFIGVCNPLVGAWYYKYQSGACVQLPSGICAGGGNLFLTQKRCMKECHILNHKSSKICLAPPAIGQCGPVVVSYYYDSQGNHCKAFNRTLCGGGGNSFVTEIECLTTCRPNKKPEPRCSISPKAGRCFLARKYYYFDETRNDCFLFPNKNAAVIGTHFQLIRSVKRDVATTKLHYLAPHVDNR